MPGPQGSIEQLFPKGEQPREGGYMVGDRHIHYVEIAAAGSGDDGSRVRILFVHGSPGGWEAWARFMADRQLQGMAHMVAVDRPGFGQSDPGRIEPDLGEQAHLLEPLLHNDGGTPTIVVGHSLGGPVAARLAMDYPDEVAAAVLIAPTLDPDLERPVWYDRFVRMKMVRALLPAAFGWASDEQARLAEQLRQMRPRWKDLRVPVTVLQGSDDGEVDPRTVDFAEKELPAALIRAIRVRRGNHHLIWNRPKLVVDAIVDAMPRPSPAIAVSTESAQPVLYAQ